VSSGDRVSVLQYLPPPSGYQIALLNAEVGFVSAKSAGRGGPDVEIDAQELSGHLAARFAGQVLTTGQELTFEYQVGRKCRAALVFRWVGELVLAQQGQQGVRSDCAGGAWVDGKPVSA